MRRHSTGHDTELGVTDEYLISGRVAIGIGFRRAMRTRIASVRSHLRARRALRELFCFYCGRHLFDNNRVHEIYCSAECAERDWARQCMAISMQLH
jgi:hypothetical protein